MDYKVVRTDRKTLALMVRKNGELEVRAPLHTTEEHIAAFVQAREDWARKHVARVLDSPPPQTEEDIAALKAQARAVLPGKAAHYGAILGLQPSAIRITETRSRYGSCSSRKVISFSCFLMLCPEEAIDYVVVHELCHLRYMNHGPDFHALLSSVLPDYRERRKRLRMPLEE